jgi:hypothetical protein
MDHDPSNATLSPASGVSLYILEDEGVFFSEPKQEIQAFNAPSTFIWCCLMEGLEPGRIVVAFAEAFAVERAEAERAVFAALHQWRMLGYINGGEFTAGTEVDFETAVGRLLCNPELRRRFALSPEEVCRDLRVEDSDVESFTSLSSQALEAQAAMLKARQENLRQGSSIDGQENIFRSVFDDYESLLEVAVEARLSKTPALPYNRRYRLLTSNFSLRFSDSKLEAQIHSLLSHLEVKAEGLADVQLEVLEMEKGFLVFQDMVPIAHSRRFDQVAALIHSLLKEIAIERHAFLLEIHGAVVSDGQNCLILPAAMRSGKTTLTAALIRSGFQYFSDDVALLEKQTLRVRPFPLSLIIKEGAETALSSFYPDLASFPAHLRKDALTVRYLIPPEGSLPDDLGKGLPIRWIVFPEYTPAGQSSLKPLKRSDAFRRLLAEAIFIPHRLRQADVCEIVQWMRRVECHELKVSSLPEAVRLLSSLCSR